jgi:hypothetical protein
MWNERTLKLRDIAFIAGTRGLLGAGIGLLAAGKLSDSRRRTLGRTLIIIGALTTIPIAMRVFKREREPGKLRA